MAVTNLVLSLANHAVLCLSALKTILFPLVFLFSRFFPLLSLPTSTSINSPLCSHFPYHGMTNSPSS